MQSHLPNGLALALMVMVNWVLAHLATNWVMPPEVSSAAQSIITALLTVWVDQNPVLKQVLAALNDNHNGNGNGGTPLPAPVATPNDPPPPAPAAKAA